MSSMGHRKKWLLFFVFCLVLFFVFSTFLFVLRAFSNRPLAYKGRANYTEASWYLATSQVVITSNYRSVITLSTRDFWSQFLWLLPPTGDKTTHVVFFCDHAIITGFPSRDHIYLLVCDLAFHSWIPIGICMATASYGRWSHIFYSFVITLSSQA